MKLKEHILALQEIMKEHGDIPLICSRDDEGNGYQKLIYEPRVMYADLSEYNIESIYKKRIFKFRKNSYS